MSTSGQSGQAALGPTFYTVPEVARILRVDGVTIYRAIRANEFPALRIRSRYIVPARALESMVQEVTASGGTLDVATMAVTRQVREAVERMGL